MADGARRLSAVMLTDIVGYTALTQHDEARALRLLEEHRQVVRPLLQEHAGREVKTIGDAFLVEFANALDATRCAVAIQRSLHDRNSRIPSSKVELRIGLHVGDVVHQDGDIYGDAVNLVSRIEPLAEPGGICVSGDVYNQVRNKIELTLAPLGTPSLKNVEFPVSLYRVELPWTVTSLGHATSWVPRPAEEELLRKAVESAANKSGSAVVLTGPSGIGKTRLAEEAIHLAEKQGFRVLRGRAFPGELATPYSHWAEMIREFLDDAPPPLLQRVGWPVAHEVAKITPAFAQKVGAPPAPAPPADPESARARFYEAVTEFFVNLSEDAPLLLLFDDLQWADASSLHLLEFIVRSVGNHRMLLLATSQDPETEGASTLAAVFRYLGKNRLLTIVPVRRMDRAAVGAMIQKTFGESEVSDEFAGLVQERTGGNPFFVEEVLRSLVEEGAVYRTAEGRWERKPVADIAIPTSIRDVVKQRFNRLDEPTQAVLRVASVLGMEFPAELLQGVAGVEEDRLIEQLERLVRAGLLVEGKRGSRLLLFSFPDPQLRSVLYGEVLSLRRVRYHRKAAELLEQLAGDRKGEFASDLAYHYREGQIAAKAREYSLLAADQWARVYGFEEAEQQYRLTLQLLEEAPDDATRARALEGLATVHRAEGKEGLAISERETAIRLYEATGEVLRGARLCREVADVLRLRPDLSPNADQRVLELLETGRRLLESIPPSSELVLLYDEWASWLMNLAEWHESREKVQKAIEVARSIGDMDSEMKALDELAGVVPLEEKEKVFDHYLAKEAYFSREGHEDWTQLAMARHNMSVAFLALRSDVPSALSWVEKGIEACRRQHNRADEATTITESKIVILQYAGELSQADQELRHVRELLGLSASDTNYDIAGPAFWSSVMRGDLEDASRHLAWLEAHGVSRFRVGSVEVSYFLRDRGDWGGAAQLLRERLATDGPISAGLPALRAPRRVRAMAALAEVLLDAPDLPRPDTEITQLSSDVHDLATRLGNPRVLGLDQRVRGKRANLAGDPKEALERFGEAAEWLQKAGDVFELAQTLEFSMRTQRKLGNLEGAEACRLQAIQVYDRMGASQRSERLRQSSPVIPV